MGPSVNSPSSTPPPQSHEYPRRWLILGAIVLTVFVLALDNTILNVALPTLATELDASASDLKWFVEAYVLVFAGLLLTGGALADRYGHRRLLLLGLGVFGAASLVSALADSASGLIAGRALMGVGGAMLFPATLAIIKHVFPDHERPRAVGLWIATAGVGAAAGPLLGGWLVEHVAWGAIFLINLPVVAITGVAAWILIPVNLPRRITPPDLVGTILSIAGITALVFAIIEAPERGWTSAAFLMTLSSAVALIAAFAVWELRIAHPMVDFRLFRNPSFSIASGSTVLNYFAIAGTSFALAQYLQFVQGYGPFDAGVRTLPLAIAVLATGVAGPSIIGPVGPKPVVVAGLALAAAGFTLLSTAGADAAYETIAASLSLLGVGVGFSGTAASDLVLASVPKDRAGAASAVNETAIELGNAFGVAVLGTVLTAEYTRGLNAAADVPPAARATASESITAAVRLAAELGGPEGAMVLAQARESFAAAMDTTALIGAVIVAVGALLAAAFLPGRRASTPPAAPSSQRFHAPSATATAESAE